MTQTQTVGQAVAQREPAPIEIIKGYRDRFASVLPDHINATQFIGLASGALYRDPKLMEAAANSPGAFANALMRCAALGHQPGTEEFYLTPRKNKKNRNLPEIQGIEGYRGIVERMYRSGAVASVIVRDVCADDYFHYVEGQDDRPIHRIGGDGTTGADFFGTDGHRNRGPMVGVYAYAILTTGAVSRVAILGAADVDAIKKRSDAARNDSGPWVTDERSMWWKSAARRLEPWVPTSAEYRREQLRAAVEADNMRRPAPSSEPLPVPVEDGVVDAEIVEPKLPEDTKRAMFAALGEAGITQAAKQLDFIEHTLGRRPAHRDELHPDDASRIIDAAKAAATPDMAEQEADS